MSLVGYGAHLRLNYRLDTRTFGLRMIVIENSVEIGISFLTRVMTYRAAVYSLISHSRRVVPLSLSANSQPSPINVDI